MNRVELLYRLQEVDTELDATHHRLHEIEDSLGETETLRQARHTLQRAEKSLRKWQASLHDLELAMAALNDKIGSNEQRLYSGAVRNPKELESLQQEMEYLRRRKSAEEDHLLEAMIQVEEHQTAFEDAQAHCQTVEAAWTTSQATLVAEKERLLVRLDELTALRTKREKPVVETDLETYEDLRRRKNGTAVARLDKSLCQRCHVEVPSSLAQRAHQGQVVFCSSCGRILFGGD
ncbi:MAG: zinc ribbon domain-containing protein [Chloroflexota bacterium]